MTRPALARAQAFCTQFGIRLPILQAPMAGASPPALAAAVGAAGGLGACGALLMDGSAIRDWAAQARALGNGAFQMNLWAPDPEPARDAAAEAAVRARITALGAAPPAALDGPFTQDFAAQCDALLAAAPPVVSTIMGLFPADMVAALKARGILWICNATTLEEARAAEAAGADAVIAQGVEAGGHRGSFDPDAAEAQQASLFVQIPRFADALRVPVIASGGIMDGRGVAAALMLGASAVQLGTAYLRSPEAGTHHAWAAALATARAEDTVQTRGFSGRLARGIRNRVTDSFAQLPAAPYPLQRAMTAPLREAAGRAGDASAMQLWAGQGVGMSVAEPAGALTTRLWDDARALLAP